MGLLLALKDPAKQFGGTLQDAAAAPLLISNLTTVGEVAGEIFRETMNEALVARREIDLVVQSEGSVIAIRRTDNAPQTVDQHNLRVDHCRLVFEDLGSGLQELAVFPAARSSREPNVTFSPGN